jgi:hypothetical protein
LTQQKRKFNTVGGGANTNRNGLEFERGTSLRDAFVDHPRYEVRPDNSVFDKETQQVVGRLYNNYTDFYENLIGARGVDYTTVFSKQLRPDDSILVGNTVYIIEKKFQAGAGSVDEKLQTCHFKKRQYARLLKLLNLKVEYYYLLSDWFKAESYRDVKEYIRDVECDYFFECIPLDRLGLL